MRLRIRIFLRQLKEKVVIKIAWKLPRYLVLWCSIRLMAYATTGEYGKEHPDDVSIMDALKRWEVCNESV